MKCPPILLGLITLVFAGFPAFSDDETAPAQRQQLFESLDADGNGRLTATELPDDQARAFQRLLRVGDADDDGELTRDEFLNATEAQDDPVTQPDAAGAARGRPRGQGAMQFVPINLLFERYDANGDDKLTREELGDEAGRRFAPLFRQIGSEEITREQLVEVRDNYFSSEQVVGLLRRLDENGNGDGRVTAAEIPEPFRPRLQPLLERFGEELDLERVSAALRQASETQRPARASRSPESRPDLPAQPRPFGGGRGPVLLRVLDDDGDNQISREELTRAADKFDQLDRNGNGKIDARELLGPPPGADRPDSETGRRPQRPERDSDDRPRTDRDGDDTRNARSFRGRPDPSMREASDRPLVSRFDRDGDNALSEDEAPRFLKPRFKEIDSNGDGLISADEFRAIRGDSRPRSDRSE